MAVCYKNENICHIVGLFHIIICISFMSASIFAEMDSILYLEFTHFLLDIVHKWKWKSLSRIRLFAPHGLYSPWNSPGQNTGVGSLSLLQGIFPTQGLSPGLLHGRRILYQLSHQGSPRILEWVAMPFSRGSSWLSNRMNFGGIVQMQMLLERSLKNPSLSACGELVLTHSAHFHSHIFLPQIGSWLSSLYYKCPNLKL